MIAALLVIVSAFTPIAPAQTAAPLSAFLEARRAEVKVRKAKWDRAQTARKHAELEGA